MIFNYFCAASNLPEHLTNWVAGFNLPPMGIMTVIVIIYIIMGALMDEASIQLLTLPYLLPTRHETRLRSHLVRGTSSANSSISV